MLAIWQRRGRSEVLVVAELAQPQLLWGRGRRRLGLSKDLLLLAGLGLLLAVGLAVLDAALFGATIESPVRPVGVTLGLFGLLAYRLLAFFMPDEAGPRAPLGSGWTVSLSWLWPSLRSAA